MSTTNRPSQPVERVRVHAALADRGRLTIVDRLLLGDASPSELQHMLSISSNLLAHHLRVLENADVVRRIRSEADRRRTYLRLNHQALEAMVPTAARRAPRVVFVCTQNSARSQLAAAIWNRRSPVIATSAGTHPAVEVHPAAVAVARRRDLGMQPRAPRQLETVLAADDLIIAVCDNVHEELPTDVDRIHWSIPDPVRATAPDAFDRTVDDLIDRIDRFVPSVQTL